MKKYTRLIAILLVLAMAVFASACGSSAQESGDAQDAASVPSSEPVPASEPVSETVEENEEEVQHDDTGLTASEEEKEMVLAINGSAIPVIWENNTAVSELTDQAASGTITVSMSMYGGWEQVGSLGRSYTREDTYINAQNGDIMLYSGNQIVVFYGSNGWEYTPLGKIDLPADEVTALLSAGNVTLTIGVE